MTMRAKTGGETGMNGEQYKGGQFLPNTALPKMQNKAKATGSKKQEIAPYVWEAAPEGKQSVYRTYNVVWQWEVRGKTFKAIDNEKTLAYFCIAKEKAQEMADKWNNGERWM
jgi:hypothetical protein